jgi:hypothetical protein
MGRRSRDGTNMPRSLSWISDIPPGASCKPKNNSSSLLKNLEIESFLILAGRCWGGATELDLIFWPGGWVYPDAAG